MTPHTHKGVRGDQILLALSTSDRKRREGFLGPASSVKSSLRQTLRTGPCPEAWRVRGEFLWLSAQSSAWGKDASPCRRPQSSNDSFELLFAFSSPNSHETKSSLATVWLQSGFKYSQHKHCIKCITHWVRGEN